MDPFLQAPALLPGVHARLVSSAAALLNEHLPEPCVAGIGERPSAAHLIEIDLLRTGEHTVAAPRYALERLGAWDYLVCLHRALHEWEFQVWPLPLRDRLPRIAIPHRAGHADVALDLQVVFARAPAEGSYRQRIDCHPDPVIPLRAQDVEWADQLLRANGLRP